MTKNLRKPGCNPALYYSSNTLYGTPHYTKTLVKLSVEIIPYLHISSDEWEQCVNWCNENLEYNYMLFIDIIYVKSEEDMMAFKLRWV